MCCGVIHRVWRQFENIKVAAAECNRGTRQVMLRKDLRHFWHQFSIALTIHYQLKDVLWKTAQISAFFAVLAAKNYFVFLIWPTMLVSISVKILLNKLDKRVQFDMRKVKSIQFTQNGKSKWQQVDRTSNQAIKMPKLGNFLVWLSFCQL